MIRRLQFYGSEILHKKSRPVEAFDDELKSLVYDMIETNYAFHGAGISAIQVGVDLRVFISVVAPVDSPDGGMELQPATVFINPEITYQSEEKIWLGEACLSIPDIYEDVYRSAVIDIKAYDLEGKPFEEKGVTGWRARNILHEYDHLDGILYIDRVPPGIMRSYKKKLRQIEKRYKSGSTEPVGKRKRQLVSREEFDKFF